MCGSYTKHMRLHKYLPEYHHLSSSLKQEMNYRYPIII